MMIDDSPEYRAIYAAAKERAQLFANELSASLLPIDAANILAGALLGMLLHHGGPRTTRQYIEGVLATMDEPPDDEGLPPAA